MNITLTQLILIIVVAVCSIMPVLYSIVITVLFVHGKYDYAILEKQYDQLRETYEGEVKTIKQKLRNDEKKAEAKRGPIGFAITREEASATEKKAEPDKSDEAA